MTHLDNRTIARHLRMMANLYEVANDHPMARVYRDLASDVRTLPYALKDQLDQYQDRAKLPDDPFQSLFALIHLGVKKAFQTLPANVPSSLREVLALPGVGPDLTRTFYTKWSITNLSELKNAMENGTLQPSKGFTKRLFGMLEQEIPKLERRMRLVPIAHGQSVAHGCQEHLLKIPGILRVEWTGELRRQKALMESVELMVEASVNSWDETIQELLKEGFQADLTSSTGKKSECFQGFSLMMDADDRSIPIRIYLANAKHFYPAWVYTSGDQSHATYIGADHTDWIKELSHRYPRDIPDEEAVYQAKGVHFIIPTLREQDSLHQDSFSLVSYTALQGDLHMHTTYSDGANSIEEMVRGCMARGYQYMAITDHSQAAKVANGLSVERLKRQHEEIEKIREKYPEISVFHGTEVDIMPDPTLDFDDDILSSLDLVVASIHTSFYLSKKEQTARILAAIASPHVDIIGHPTGRMLGRRDGYTLDFEQIFAAATANRVALELNCNPSRLDLDPEILRLALAAGCLFSIDSDAHSFHDLERIPAFGIGQAQQGWLPPDRVINTWSFEMLSAWLNQ